MPDLRIHEYATRRELFEALPKDRPIYGWGEIGVEEALKKYVAWTGKQATAAWMWKDLVFVGEEDGE